MTICPQSKHYSRNIKQNNNILGILRSKVREESSNHHNNKPRNKLKDRGEGGGPTRVGNWQGTVGSCYFCVAHLMTSMAVSIKSSAYTWTP